MFESDNEIFLISSYVLVKRKNQWHIFFSACFIFSHIYTKTKKIYSDDGVFVFNFHLIAVRMRFVLL